MGYLNRVDHKWAHPENAEAGWYTAADLVPAFMNLESRPFEELYAVRDMYRNTLLESILVNCPSAAKYDWNYYISEKGCPMEENTPVRILVGRPKDVKPGKKLPCVLSFSGGGLVNGGTAELNVNMICNLMESNGKKATIVCFEYRLAPMDKYPAAINDCHAAFQWVVEHSKDISIDTNNIVFFGCSSGGHLALASTFRLKRYNWCGAPMPKGIIVTVPIMDGWTETLSNRYSMKNEKGEILSYDNEISSYGMKLWLGDLYGTPDVPPEAIPAVATAEDIKGFPPVWFAGVGEFDSSRDSCYRFARLLHEAGIYCDLHMWGGTNHSFVSDQDTDFGKRAHLVVSDSIADAIDYDFRRPWLNEEG